MQYLLDTNICIYYFKGQFGLKEKIERIGYEQFAISEITIAELVYGAQKSVRVEQNMQTVNSFIQRVTVLPIFNTFELYGREKARLERLGTPISDFDILIGATAVINRLSVVTRNAREFQRLENLNVENWVGDTSITND
jgi:tRNA(fMet)-specific endonuclease VapC